jgi:hypothetical protein
VDRPDASTSERGVTIEAFEDEIRSLPAIRAARVISTAGGRISEVHVVADGGKSAKQLVRDVQTLAQATFGLEIDHRVVSIVQFEDRTVETSAPRPVLANITVSVESAQLTCLAEVACGGKVTAGRAQGPASSVTRLRLGAEAVAGALTESAETAVAVVDTKLVELGSARLVVVVLVIVVGGGVASGQTEQVAAGAAISVGEDTEAAARAALEAYRTIRPLRA